MGKLTERVVFPCGFKYEIIAEGWGTPLFTTWNFQKDLKSMICPIHGKDCKAKKIK